MQQRLRPRLDTNESVFPVTPPPGAHDGEPFVVQDAELRACILPLFSFNPEVPSERVVGQGTTFRIDPWSRCATAFHVVEELFELDGANALVLRPQQRLAALELNGLVYGVPPATDGAWRPISEAFAYFGIETPPMGAARIRNSTELIALRIRPSQLPEAGTPYLRVDLRLWRPRTGEKVQALGYANLDRTFEGARDDRPISQYLYACTATITDIEPADGARGRPWPLFRVEADWPGGMSGGPVFNEAGFVIGLVSAGFKGAEVSTATYFPGWDVPERTFGSLDPDNPGWFRCYAVFDAAGALVHRGQDEQVIARFAEAQGFRDFGRVSLDPTTGEYARI